MGLLPSPLASETAEWPQYLLQLPSQKHAHFSCTLAFDMRRSGGRCAAGCYTRRPTGLSVAIRYHNHTPTIGLGFRSRPAWGSDASEIRHSPPAPSRVPSQPTSVSTGVGSGIPSPDYCLSSCRYLYRRAFVQNRHGSL